MSRKQRRSIIGGAIAAGMGYGLHVLGLPGIALCGFFIGAGLIGLGANIAYGMGTLSANMSPDVKTNAN